LGKGFGLIGVLTIIGLFMWMTPHHASAVSRSLDRLFAGLAQGVGIWIGFQTFINIGVNLDLPTKGPAAADELWRFSHSDESGRAGGRAASTMKTDADARRPPVKQRYSSWPVAQVAIFFLCRGRGLCVNAGWRVHWLGGLGSADLAWKSQLVPPRGLRLSRLPFRVCAAKALSCWLGYRCPAQAFWRIQVIRRWSNRRRGRSGGSYISFPAGMMASCWETFGASREQLRWPGWSTRC
jgi:hypothetical protein